MDEPVISPFCFPPCIPFAYINVKCEMILELQINEPLSESLRDTMQPLFLLSPRYEFLSPHVGWDKSLLRRTDLSAPPRPRGSVSPQVRHAPDGLGVPSEGAACSSWKPLNTYLEPVTEKNATATHRDDAAAPTSGAFI